MENCPSEAMGQPSLPTDFPLPVAVRIQRASPEPAVTKFRFDYPAEKVHPAPKHFGRVRGHHCGSGGFLEKVKPGGVEAAQFRIAATFARLVTRLVG